MPEHPGIEAGVLDKRATLLAPVYNDAQDEIASWNPVTTVWAGIAPGVGREINQAGRTVAVTQVIVIMRYRADIDERWRVQDRDRIYQIKNIVDVLRRHVQLQLTCEEVQ